MRSIYTANLRSTDLELVAYRLVYFVPGEQYSVISGKQMVRLLHASIFCFFQTTIMASLSQRASSNPTRSGFFKIWLRWVSNPSSETPGFNRIKLGLRRSLAANNEDPVRSVNPRHVNGIFVFHLLILWTEEHIAWEWSGLFPWNNR